MGTDGVVYSIAQYHKPGPWLNHGTIVEENKQWKR